MSGREALERLVAAWDEGQSSIGPAEWRGFSRNALAGLREAMSPALDAARAALAAPAEPTPEQVRQIWRTLADLGRAAKPWVDDGGFVLTEAESVAWRDSLRDPDPVTDWLRSDAAVEALAEALWEHVRCRHGVELRDALLAQRGGQK